MSFDRPIVIALAASIAGVAKAIAEEYEDGYINPPTGVRTREEDRDRGAAWVASCLSDDEQLFAESRLRRPVFEALAQYLRAQGVRDGIALVEEKLLTFTYICGNGASWRNVRYRSGRSLDTVSK